jgi:pyridoxal phosphate enzyme (YggS family)
VNDQGESVTEGSVSHQLSDRLAAVQSAVDDAAKIAGRSASEITTIVVTKFHPASLVRDLAALGVSDFGENRHQEASAKAAEVADLGLTWHFVGQLQSKKARQARAYARVIHSLDRESVIDALASTEAQIDGFVQLNLTGDQARGGVQPDQLEQVAERVLATEGLRLLGVMAVAPIDEEPRRAFERVREASARLVALHPEARYISAGMSGDFREAVLEGATHLRIGSAITGNRVAPG